MQKPYVKKLCKVSHYEVWQVDGVYVRNNISEEFTNYGHHLTFKFIPKNEFWIDKETVPGEEQYYIDHLLAEHRFMSHGKSYDFAFNIANSIEHRERNKSEFLKSITTKDKSKVSLLSKVKKTLIKKYSGAVKVWIVNGELVRDLFLVYFSEGGHDLVYNFIPKDEIWIDDDISPRERKLILLHEIHERNLMRQGWGYCTDSYFNKKHPGVDNTRSAHLDASDMEHYCRLHPEKLNEMLKGEILISNQLETKSNFS